MLPIRPPVIVHHMAALDARYPPNSLEGIAACLDASADIVEVDITALQSGDYILVHDPELASETTGHGQVERCTAADVASLRITWNGLATPFRVPTLSQVVGEFLRQVGSRSKLQLDLKNTVPFPDDEPLRDLARLVEPLGDQVQVSTNADWQLRRLRAVAPWLDLGLDVHFYLDLREPGAVVDPLVPPRHLGAYGYWDDHPLARRRIWPTPSYLEDRVAALVGLVPGLSTFYVGHELLIRSFDDGFNWARFLHERGIKLDAWTLDTTSAVAARNAIRLLAAGVDQFTTNTPNELRRVLR